MKKLSSLLLRALFFPLAALPLKVHHFFAGFIKWLAKDVIRYRRGIVMMNLSRAFPEKKYKELKQIEDRFYSHFADIFVESVWFSGCRNPKRFTKRNPLSMDNCEELTRLLENHPSVVILTSHCGNWEYVGAMPIAKSTDGTPSPFNSKNLVAVYKRQSSAAWDDFLSRSRTAPINDPEFDGYVETYDFMLYAVRNLIEGKKKLFILNSDQSPYGKTDRKPIGEFLHQQTQSMVGGAVLAKKKHLPVVYMYNTVDSRGQYRLSFTTIAEDPSGMTPEEIMRKFYDLLQKDIEAQPWNYLWTHNRWKLS